MKPEEVEEAEDDNSKGKKQNLKQGIKTGIQELMNNHKKDDKDSIDRQQVEFMIQKACEDLHNSFALDVRNQEADKLVMETKMRKTMQDLVAPLVEQGIKHKEQFIENIHTLNDHESRISFIEIAIFKSDKSEDRFEGIYKKIAEMEEMRVSDIQNLKNQILDHQNDIQEIVHNQTLKLKEVDDLAKICERTMKMCKETDSTVTHRVLETQNLVKNQLEKYIDKITNLQKDLDNHQRELQYQNSCIERISQQVQDIDKQQIIHSGLLEKDKIEIDNLKLQKADISAFYELVDDVNKKLSDNNELTQLNKNQIISCHNFIDKYLPLLAQRQMFEFFDYVLTSVKQKWRLKKFSDQREEVLIENILKDDGKADLSVQIDHFKQKLASGQPLNDEAAKPFSISSQGTSKKKLGLEEEKAKDTVSDDLSKTKHEEANDDEGKEGGGDGDLDSQIQQIVIKQVNAKSQMLEEKFKYWHQEVQNTMSSNFIEINKCLLEQLNQIQQDISFQHQNHIIDMERVRISGLLTPEKHDLGKQMIYRVGTIEKEIRDLKTQSQLKSGLSNHM